MGWVVVAALVGIPLAIWGNIKARTCPNCGQRMERTMEGFWSNRGTMDCACGYQRQFVRQSTGDSSYDKTVGETYPQPPPRPRSVPSRLRPKRPSILPAKGAPASSGRDRPSGPPPGSSILPADVPKKP